MADLKSSLKDAVRKLARQTSVDSLKKRGVKQVNVLGLDRIVSLIDEAVHRSLRHKLLSSEREAVVDATKEEFLKLLRSNEELRARQERAEEESNNLRLEMQRLQGEIDERVAEASVDLVAGYEGENAQILLQIQSLFANAKGADDPGLVAKVQELVVKLVTEQRHEVEIAQAAARDREIHNLQRRLKKLNDSLEFTEQKLDEVSRMKNVEEGVASVYRDVQGLKGGGQEVERKKELMAGLFAANMKLQKGG